MDKRYQVFVSSTYADLQHERQKVIQALMEMDCIPAGMELFPAADEEQWAFIKRIIDDCDYYLLIIGGRYGTLTPEGISYTEKEYDYAISRDLKVLAFVHESPGDIPAKHTELDPALRKKLDAFREKVATNRLVKLWKSAAELPGLVSLSLSKTIKTYPAVGWVRANAVANDALLRDLNELRKENAQLRSSVKSLQDSVPDNSTTDLASLDDPITVRIEYTVYTIHGSHKEAKPVTTTWADIFARIAPDLLEHPSDALVSGHLGSALYRKLHGGRDKSADLLHDDFQTVKIQLIALGLVVVNYSATVKGGMALFWSMTKYGQNVMTQLRTIKKAGIQPGGSPYASPAAGSESGEA